MDRLPQVGETVGFNHISYGWVRATVILLPRWAEGPDGSPTPQTRPITKGDTCTIEYLGSWFTPRITDLREVPPSHRTNAANFENLPALVSKLLGDEPVQRPSES